MGAPYDQRIANESAAADQCMKLGAILLSPRARRAGFAGAPNAPETSPEQAQDSESSP